MAPDDRYRPNNEKAGVMAGVWNGGPRELVVMPNGGSPEQACARVCGLVVVVLASLAISFVVGLILLNG
jgi:hypothetical protein